MGIVNDQWRIDTKYSSTIHHLLFTIYPFMDSAFALHSSAPTARASHLTNLHRRRTRHATDRWIALIMKRVIGHVVLGNVVPDITHRPRGKRIDLDETKSPIPLNQAGVRSLGRLITANGCNPGAHPPERFS